MADNVPNLILGCGYLGRRVARLWQRRQQPVMVITRSAAKCEELRRAGLQCRLGDLCDPACFPQEFPDVDCVLFAVGYDRSPGKTQEQLFVDGLRNVLNAIGRKCRRLVYISTTGVYGQHDGSWVDEASPCEPSQPGGKCCLAAEELIGESLANGRLAGSAVILRLAGIYGPGRLLSRVADLQAGKPLSGRPDAWLNLIHVEDAAAAVLCAERAERPSAVYIVADDLPVRRRDYYSRLAELVGAPPPTFDSALPNRRGAGELNKRCSNQRMKAELGMALRYATFEVGLPDALCRAE
jgi:nucleoside-diphosphate-sugar epimerase